MKNKIFKSIFIAIIIAFLLSSAVVFICLYNTVSKISGVEYDAWQMLGEILAPMLLVFGALALIAYFVASMAARNVVKPINEIDPEHPERTKTYDELRPIMDKLISQNYKISRQMDTLRMRENEFNSITFNMSEGLVVINSRAAILSCNRSAKEIFAIKETPKSVLSLDSSEGFRGAIGAALSGNSGYHAFRSGERYYSLFATPVLHEKHVEGAVVVIVDVTEKEEREALRREFSSNVSHELKTPLTAISGFAELIKSGMASPADAAHFAENIHKEASRLISLVGDIIRLSRLDGGEIPYDEEPVDLYAIATEVADMLAGVAERAEIMISVTGEAAPVSGNSTIIEEIIYNLSDNAIKYNRKGGWVRIDARPTEHGARITVSDNGIGIPADKRDRVFERFYRVDKSHSREIGGTGLGLSIVKHAALYHKATVSLESEEGVGTTVTVSFPK